MNGTNIRLLWRDRRLCQRLRTGVSLHSHTMHSRESLVFIPRLAAHIPALARELERVARRYKQRTGRDLDYRRGYFTPPLPGREALDLERQQIEELFAIRALVSLSDHDNIEAGLRLHASGSADDVPLSVEWTVPLPSTYFHLGIHNLPPRSAHSIVAGLNSYTSSPSSPLRRELLDMLGGLEETLVVLNHPLWDQADVGSDRHRAALAELLAEAGGNVHALELNGLRPWAENRAVTEMARASGRTLVAGGDRHGCEPNSVINLTNASSFSEFIQEVRQGASEIVFLDHYRHPRAVRIIRAICDIMGDFPDLAGRERWDDRVHCRRFSDEIMPISELWNGYVPRVVRLFEGTVRLLRGPGMQRLLRLWFTRDAEFEFD